MQHPILSLLAKKTDIPRKGYKERSRIHRAIITPRIAGAPLHLRIDSGRTTPARPSARAPGSRAAHIASAPAVHASGNRGSHQSSATRAAQQVPTAAVHHKTARARRSRRPDPCVPRTAPREPQRPTSTASCCTPLTQDLQRQAPHLHRPCPRAAPCPNIAPGRMGCDWPMTDQSAVRCTADMLSPEVQATSFVELSFDPVGTWKSSHGMPSSSSSTRTRFRLRSHSTRRI